MVEDLAQTLAVKGIEFVGLWLCQCGRFHPICDHGDEGGFVDLELPWDCEVGVPPEQVQLVEGCPGFAYSGVDICVGGAVLPDVDSKVPGLCFDFDCE